MLESQTEIEAILVRSALSEDERVRETLERELVNLKRPLNSSIHSFLKDALEYSKVTGSRMSEEVAGEWAAIVASATDLRDPSAPTWAIHQLNQRFNEDKLASDLLQTMRILKTGLNDHGVPLRGIDDAVSFVRARLPALHDTNLVEEYDLHQMYLDANEKPVGFKTGFSVLDDLTGGVASGELWFIGAYTGQGKTQFLLNLVYNFRVNEGFHVLFWSTESPPSQLDLRLASRHSCNPMFNSASGVPVRNIRLGKLSYDQEKLYLDRVLPDWTSDNYPPITFRKAPYRASWDTIVQESEIVNSRRKVDVLIIDYLSQLRPSRLRNNEREDLTELIIEAKQTALTFDQGRSVPLVTAGQTNPTSYLKALEVGRYSIRSIADSAEAERSSDFLMYLLRRSEDKELGELSAGVLKYRMDDGDVHFRLKERFPVSMISDLTLPDVENSIWDVSF